MEPTSNAAPPIAPLTSCAGEVRCGCGRLVARIVPGGVELKCQRCKQIVVVPLAGPAESLAANPAPRMGL